MLVVRQLCPMCKATCTTDTGSVTCTSCNYRVSFLWQHKLICKCVASYRAAKAAEE